MVTVATSQFHQLFNIVGFFPILVNVFLSAQMNGLLFYEIFCQRALSNVAARIGMHEHSEHELMYHVMHVHVHMSN